jgi:hypothetical protein
MADSIVASLSARRGSVVLFACDRGLSSRRKAKSERSAAQVARPHLVKTTVPLRYTRLDSGQHEDVASSCLHSSTGRESTLGQARARDVR